MRIYSGKPNIQAVRPLRVQMAVESHRGRRSDSWEENDEGEDEEEDEAE